MQLKITVVFSGHRINGCYFLWIYHNFSIATYTLTYLVDQKELNKEEEFLNARGKDIHFLKLTMCKILNIILVSTRRIAFLKQVKASMTRNKTR